MYIKMKHHITGLTQVLNIDIDKYVRFYTVGNELWLVKPTKIQEYNDNGDALMDEENRPIMINEKDILTFTSEQEAEFARDSIFMKMGSKAPENRVLDLVTFSEMEQDEYIYVDMNDLAQLYKTSPDKIRVVSVSNNSESDEAVQNAEQEIVQEDE